MNSTNLKTIINLLVLCVLGTYSIITTKQYFEREAYYSNEQLKRAITAINYFKKETNIEPDVVSQIADKAVLIIYHTNHTPHYLEHNDYKRIHSLKIIYTFGNGYNLKHSWEDKVLAETNTTDWELIVQYIEDYKKLEVKLAKE